jgi:hypothetical protein
VTQQFLVYVDDVHIFEGNTNTIKKTKKLYLKVVRRLV